MVVSGTQRIQRTGGLGETNERLRGIDKGLGGGGSKGEVNGEKGKEVEEEEQEAISSLKTSSLTTDQEAAKEEAEVIAEKAEPSEWGIKRYQAGFQVREEAEFGGAGIEGECEGETKGAIEEVGGESEEGGEGARAWEAEGESEGKTERERERDGAGEGE